MRVSLLRRVRPTTFLVLLFMSCREAPGQDFLNLVIPEFKGENATLEQAITELHKWGIPVCLEKVPSDEQVTFFDSSRECVCHGHFKRVGRG